MDRAFRDWVVDGEEFTAEETALLLDAVPHAALPAATLGKLERMGMAEDSPAVRARNLRAAVKTS